MMVSWRSIPSHIFFQLYENKLDCKYSIKLEGMGKCSDNLRVKMPYQVHYQRVDIKGLWKVLILDLSQFLSIHHSLYRKIICFFLSFTFLQKGVKIPKTFINCDDETVSVFVVKYFSGCLQPQNWKKKKKTRPFRLFNLSKVIPCFRN